MPFARSQLSTVALALASLSLAVPAPVPTGGNVLAVDDDGSAPFATIQAAVDAAQDGDVVLVRSGTYPRFQIGDKALVVTGDVGAQVQVQGGVRVAGLAASRTVVLANLSSTGTPSADLELSSGLELANCAGHVRVEACVLAGGGTSSNGVRARGCADVALAGCDVRGGPAHDYSALVDSDGIAASESSIVTVHDCVVRGGDGLPGSCSPGVGHDGGDGGDVRGAFLFGAGSSFEGGRGGRMERGASLGCPGAGSGGDGIRAQSSSAQLLDTATIAGLYGECVGSCGGTCCDFGYTGSDRSGATFSDLVGDARILATASPDNAGATTTITVSGAPGDTAALLVSGAPATAEFVPGWNGMLLVPKPRIGGTTRVVQAGSIPASGVLGVPFVLPAPSPAGTARTLFVQALFRDAQGQYWLSGARSLTVLP